MSLAIFNQFPGVILETDKFSEWHIAKYRMEKIRPILKVVAFSERISKNYCFTSKRNFHIFGQMVSTLEPLFSKARMPNNEKQIIILRRLKSHFSNDVMELYATVKRGDSTCIGRVDIEDTFNCKLKTS